MRVLAALREISAISPLVGPDLSIAAPHRAPTLSLLGSEIVPLLKCLIIVISAVALLTTTAAFAGDPPCVKATSYGCAAPVP